MAREHRAFGSNHQVVVVLHHIPGSAIFEWNPIIEQSTDIIRTDIGYFRKTDDVGSNRLKNTLHCHLRRRFVHPVIHVPKGHPVECSFGPINGVRGPRINTAVHFMRKPLRRKPNLTVSIVPLQTNAFPDIPEQLTFESDFKFVCAVRGRRTHADFIQTFNSGTTGVADGLSAGKIQEQVNTQALVCIIHSGVGVIIQIQQQEIFIGQDVFIQTHFIFQFDVHVQPV